MLDIVKKRHSDDGPLQGPPPPPQAPPLRTFVISGINQATGEPISRTVDAHGLAIDEARMISFIVFFQMDGKLVQTAKLVINADAWTDVEEINVLFPTMLVQ